MPEMAKRVRIEYADDGTRHLYINDVEFPWYTSGQIKYEDVGKAKGFKIISIPLALDGEFLATAPPSLATIKVSP